LISDPVNIHYTHIFISLFLFFFTATSPTQIYTLSLHDALPISFESTGGKPVESNSECCRCRSRCCGLSASPTPLTLLMGLTAFRSEEHTSELQSRSDLVCRLLLEKKKKKMNKELFCK